MKVESLLWEGTNGTGEPERTTQKLLTGVSTMPPVDWGQERRWVMMIGTVGHVRSRTWPHTHTHSCRPGTMALILFLPEDLYLQSFLCTSFISAQLSPSYHPALLSLLQNYKRKTPHITMFSSPPYTYH